MIALLAFMVSPSHGQTFADLVKTHALTASDEHKIGHDYVELAGWLHGQVEDPELVRRVEKLTRQVLAASDRPDLVVNVIVSNTDEVNAAAYPGGYLVVNRGVVDLLEDDELAFVIAHEISHVLLRHYANGENLKVASETLSVAKVAMTGLDRDAALSANDELIKMWAAYGRQLEYEADLYGLLYAVRAGFPSDVGARTMKKLETASPSELPLMDEAYSNHPSHADRIVEMKKGLDTVNRVLRAFDQGVAYLNAGDDSLAIEAFQDFLTLFPKSAAGWSNLASAHLRLGLEASSDPWFEQVPLRTKSDVTVRSAGNVHFDRAAAACDRALAINTQFSQCWTMLGVMSRQQGDLDSARAMYERALSVSGPNATVFVNQAVLEASAGNLDKARALLAKATATEPHNVYIQLNTAVLLEKEGKLDAAKKIWTQLLESGRFRTRAQQALKRLGVAPEKREAPEGSLTLGPLAVGMSEAEVYKILGKVTYESRDGIGLSSYRSWDDKGVSVVFTAGRVMGMECYLPCALDVSGVRIGDRWATVRAHLGAPTEESRGSLYLPGDYAYYEGSHLTVEGSEGVVNRLAFWQ